MMPRHALTETCANGSRLATNRNGYPVRHTEKAEAVTRITPYGTPDEKTRQVERMFDNIAPAYDAMNTAMSLGMHRLWRKTMLNRVRQMEILTGAPDRTPALDIATGTGDVAIALARMLPDVPVVGIDLSEEMLAVGRKKISSLIPDAPIELLQADCLHMPFAADTFRLATVAYGVRNFADLPHAYAQIMRVLIPGGVLGIIELCEPRNIPVRALYRLYAGKLIPAVGGAVSGDKNAYTYLPQSIAACPARTEMTALLCQAGFTEVNYKIMPPGVVGIYTARKPFKQ